MKWDSTPTEAEKNSNDAVQNDAVQVHQHLGEKVRSMVKQTLEAIPDAETDDYEDRLHIGVGEIQNV